MALKSTNVDTDVLKYAARNIDDNIKRLSAASTYFLNTTMSELDPYWDGAAKKSFENKFLKFRDNFDKLVKSFDSLNNKLKETEKNYTGADNEVSNAIGKLGR